MGKNESYAGPKHIHGMGLAWKVLKRDKYLCVMVLPGLILLVIFKYIPMYGILMSFQNYNPGEGILGSQWVGLKHIIQFFNDPYAYRLVRNTLLLGILSLIFGFPAPIILALSFNEVGNRYFKKVSQTLSYLPYFISVVIIVGIMKDFLMIDSGKINDLIAALGFERISFMTSPEWFRPIYVVSGIWQSVGFSSIIYLASLTGIDSELYQASVIDGASRLQSIWYISLPSIKPIIVIMFILEVGSILNSDFQKILLMYNPLTYETGDVLSTYIYRQGIEGASYSYASAVGLFFNLVSFFFLYAANKVSRKLGDSSLW